MPSLATVLPLLCIPLVALLAARTFGLVNNYLAARKLGLPIVLIPVSWQDAFWILIYPYFRFLRNLPLIGDIVDFSYHAWPQDLRYRPHQRYGDAFIVVSPKDNEIIFNDPAVGVELQNHYKNWIKPEPMYEIFRTFGSSVLTVNGDDWQRHRKIVNPAFREQNNKLVWEESLKQARQMLHVVMRRPGASETLLAVRNDCVLIALHVLSAAGFGHAHDFDGGLRDVPEGHSESLADALMFLLSNILHTVLLKNIPALRWMMPAKAREVKAMTKEFSQYQKEIIAYNRATTQGGGGRSTADIVSALVEANEAAKREEKAAGRHSGAKPAYLTDEEVTGNLYVFNLAGFETTANALTYTIPFLAANPAVQEWVGEEIDAVVKDKDIEKLDYEEVFPSLVRCLALMYETLRLWGPVPSIGRWASPEHQTLRYHDRDLIIPAGTYVSANIYGIHSDPRWWGDDGLEWRPRRWITTDPATGKESIAPAPPGTAYMAWSTGPRICPGKKFSQVEFVAVISTVLRGFRLKPLVVEGKMETDEQARAALLEVMEDSMNVITPKMRRPEDAGVVFVAR